MNFQLDPEAPGQAVLAHYGYSRQTTTRTATKEIDLDPIEADLIGRFNVSQLYFASPSFIQHGLALVLEKSTRKARVPEKPCEEEREKRKDPPSKKIDMDIADVIRAFCVPAREVGDHMFELLEKDHCRESMAHANAFCVEKKSTGKHRLIIDARAANREFSGKDEAFSVFAVESLVRVISNLAIDDEWFCVSEDLRHMFHQIPLPYHLQPYFTLHLPFKEGPDGKAVRVVPRTLPMGWHPSPHVGQSATWGLLLNTGGKDPLPPIKVGEDICGLSRETLSNIQQLPAWLPLKGGGGIFIIIDNIFIATPFRKVAEY